MIAQSVRVAYGSRTADVTASLHGVSKRYGSVEALDSVDLELRRGEFLALLGPNGAGKTTAVALMLGIRRADSGTVRLLGRNPRDLAARKRVGLAPQFYGFPPTLTVRELLDFVRNHYDRAPTLDELIERSGLCSLADRQTRTLSGGQQKVLGLALAFAGNPEVVFLDEPTSGLDTFTRRTLWSVLAAYVRSGGTALLTTHYLHEAEALASRVVLMMQGRLVREGSVADIVSGVGISRVTYHGTEAADLPGVVRVERKGGAVTLYVENADECVRTMVRHGVDFRNLHVSPASLEDAFLAITCGEPS